MKLQGNMLKKTSMRFAAALLGALAGFIAGPDAALAASPQHHDQVPGFYRLKVGDLEVTALLDGPAVLDLHWLTGEKATLDGVVKALHEDPHILDAVDTGFLVNTGKQVILVDAGSGTWFGRGAYGHLVGNLQIFLGWEAINRYGHFLQSNLELIWPARIGLLVMVVLPKRFCASKRAASADMPAARLSAVRIATWERNSSSSSRSNRSRFSMPRRRAIQDMMCLPFSLQANWRT